MKPSPSLPSLSKLSNHFLSIHIYPAIVLALMLAVPQTSYGLDYYWVNGSGNWSAFASHWAKVPNPTVPADYHLNVPTASDDVFFTDNSGVAYTVFANAGSTVPKCRNMNWTTAPNGVVLDGNGRLDVYGSLILKGGMTVTSTVQVFFISFGAASTITSNGVHFSGNINFEGTSGGWMLNDALFVDGTITHTGGTLMTNNQSVTIVGNFQGNSPGRIYLEDSEVSLFGLGRFHYVPADFDAGTSHIIVVNPNGLEGNYSSPTISQFFDVTFNSNLNLLSSQGFAFGSIGGTLRFIGTGIIHSYSLPATPVLNHVIFEQDGLIINANDYNHLTLTAGKTYTIRNYSNAINADQTILPGGSINANSSTACNDFITIRSWQFGESVAFDNQSGNNITLTGLALQDIHAIGPNTLTNDHGINVSNTNGWVFTNECPGLNLYWIGGAGDWDDLDHWSMTSGGPPCNCIPTPTTNVFFDANSGFLLGNQIVNVPVDAYCRDMSWTGVTGNPTLGFDVGGELFVYGSLAFAPSGQMTNNFQTPIHFRGSGMHSLTSSGQHVGTIIFEATGVYDFADALFVNQIYHTNGIVRTMGFPVTIFRWSGKEGPNGTQGNPNAELWLGNPLTGTSSVITFEQTIAGCCEMYFRCNYDLGKFHAMQSHIIFNDGYSIVDGSPVVHDFWKVSFLNVPASRYARFYNHNILDKLTYTGTGKGYIYGEGNTINEVDMLMEGEINGNHTYNIITFAGGNGYQLQNDKIQTVGSINVNTNCEGMANLYSPYPNTTAKIAKTSGALALNNVSLDNVLPDLTTGATYSATNSIGLQSQVIADWNLTNPPARNLFWVGGAGEWHDSNHWSSSSNGAGGECPPTPFDDVFFNAASGLGVGDAVIINQVWAFCKNMDWTGGSGILANGLAATTWEMDGQILQIFGDLTFANTMVNEFYGVVRLRANQPATITSAGNHFKGNLDLWEPAGDWSLNDALYAGIHFRHTYGKFRTNNFPMTIAGSWQGGATASMEAFMGNSTVTFNGNNNYGYGFADMYYLSGTFHCGTSSFIFDNPGFARILGNGHNPEYYNVTFKSSNSQLLGAKIKNKLICEQFVSLAYANGDNYIHDAEFRGDALFGDSRPYHSIKFFPGKRYTFEAGTTQTIVPFNGVEGQFIAQGLPGQYIEIKSSSFTSNATIHMDDSNNSSTCTKYLFLTAMTHSGTEEIYVPTPGGDVCAPPGSGCSSPGWLFFPCNPCPASVPILDVAVSDIEVCLHATAKLVLDNLKADEWAVWFDDAAATNVVYNGGTPGANLFEPVITANKTYYAKVFSDGGLCYSTVLLTVNVTAIPSPDLFNVTGGGTVCLESNGTPIGLDGSVAGVSYQLLLNGLNIGAAVAGTGNAITFGNQDDPGTYTVVATLVSNGCTRTMSGSATITTDPSLAPGIDMDSNAPLPNCTGDLELSEFGGSAITWLWSGPNGFYSTLQNPVIPNVTTAAAGIYTLLVTGANGCTNTADLDISVLFDDMVLPHALCQNATVALTANGQYTLLPAQVDNGSYDDCSTVMLSVSPSLLNCSHLGTLTVTLTVTDGASLTATCTAQVTVQDNIAPTALCHASITASLGSNGMVTITPAMVNNGSFDNCSIIGLSVSPNLFICEDLGPHTVTLTVTDQGSLTNTCQTTVNVVDDLPPTAVCQNINLSLSATGTATVAAWMLDGGSFDNCGLDGISIPPTVFDCSGVGPHNVTLTVTDLGGLMNTCIAIVTVVDDLAPVALCQNITVNLDANGVASITAAQVNNGSSDNCGIPALSVSPSVFSCANIGANTVTLTAAAGGLISNCNATVNVQDNTPPTALCQNITVALVAGQATVTAAQINNASFDNCGIASLSLNQTVFTCANTGSNNVTLTVTDVHSLSNTCSATVSIQDNIPPVAVCQNVTVQLNSTGNASVTAAQVNNGSSDNCAIVSMSVSPNTFTCANIGTNPVMLTVTDAANLSNTCNATITVQDNTAPTAVCQNITVNLNASGNATITAAQINNGSSDNCGTPALSINNGSFTCANVGMNSVTLTATDGGGLTHTCMATVTVADITPPMAICQNLSLSLGGGGSVTVTAAQVNNGSTDNCGIFSLSLSPTMFSCANAGPNNATMTVTDVNGLTNTCTASITISDGTAPTALCIGTPLDLFLNAAGNVSVTAAQINNGSSDNCGTPSLSVGPASFTCADLGPQLVTLTVTDGGGLTNTCTASVTVMDNIAPMAVCQNISVNLNATGTATIIAAQVNNNSSDNCGTPALSINNGSFTCANVGTNNITLTATDGGGLTHTCTAIVTIQDNAPPTASCQNINVATDINGNATITAAQINNGSSDNCGIFSMNVSPGILTCANAGANNVTLTVTDIHGLTSTCTATVTIQDNAPPTALCQNITANLNASGNATITAAQVNNGSHDDCGTPTLAVSQNSFTCANLGGNLVTLTVTDAVGLSSTCTGTVTIADNIPPIAVCQNINVLLGASGSATITAAQINNGSSDNCGIVSMSVSPAIFTCANSGANNVTLTVMDAVGLSGTCMATVTIQDNAPPVAVCQNMMVSLNAAGQATIAASSLDGGSYDDCGTVSLAIGQNTFDCSNIGTNTVTLTVTDLAGLSSTCQATVTVSDPLPPMLTCGTTTVLLGINGTATLLASQITQTSSDNCGIASLTIPPTVFDCSSIGNQQVTLTATDVNGLTATCQASITVVDNLPPTALCQPATVTLDGNGAATVTVPQINNGSWDNCAVASVSISQNSFDCSDVGTQMVTLTVTDGGGLTSTCQAAVTVEDNQVPTLGCQDVTISLGQNGLVHLDPMQVISASDDNCNSGMAFTLSQSLFNCDDIGTNAVTLTATDVGGNSVTCSFNVEVLSYLVISNIVVTDESCPGTGDGSIIITANTPFPGQHQILYSVTGGAWWNLTGEFYNLTPGTYEIVVRIQKTTYCYAYATVVVNEGYLPQTWYKDFDLDGYSDGVTLVSCFPSEGFYLPSSLTATWGDCNDFDADQYPGQTWYMDMDNDGYSNGTWLVACAQPYGYKTAANCIAISGDCNDANVNIHPVAEEICNNIDDNCNGVIDEGLSNLVYQGNVTFANQTQVDAWSQCYTVINGNLLIQNANIDSLSSLINLQKVTGNVTIKTTGLVNLAGLLNLDTIGGTLNIHYNSQLQNLHGLEILKLVGGDLLLFHNHDLFNCCAIEDLINSQNGKDVGGLISVYLNATGCDNISQINTTCNPNQLIAPLTSGSALGFEAFEPINLKIYPNPAQHEITLYFPNEVLEAGEVQVLDLRGMRLLGKNLETGLSKHFLSLEELPKGVYILKVFEDGVPVWVEKVVKL